MELLPDGVENRSHQQGAKQSLRHSAQSINAIPLAGKSNVLTLEKCF